ncbi:MAG: nucleotidyltransferase family protein [Planctomycetota bacterium]|jgi:molybdenum cofactor cytidylyltransferase
MRVAGILLGGGHSKRFGGPKLEARIAGVRLIDRACANFLDAGLDPVVFCGDLAPADPRVLRAPRGEAMLETLRCGLATIPEGPFAFAPADLGFLDPALIARLEGEFERLGCRYLVPVHGGRGGHPAFARDAAAFLDPDLEGGARAVWRAAGDELVRLEVETADILFDIDRPEDLKSAGNAASRRARLLERGDLSA